VHCKTGGASLKDKKSHILKIAKKRIDRFGFAKTTMDEISKDAGLSKKTLYQYFKKKDDLFLVVFLQEALKLRTFALGKSDKIKDPVKKIKTTMLSARDYLKKNPFMVKVLRDEDGLYASFLHKEKFNNFVDEGIIYMLQGFLKEGIEMGRFRKMDTYIVAYCIIKLFQSLTYTKTMNPQKAGSNENNSFEEMMKLLFDGILKK
jgi:AcrR family transcriptional regulator